MYATMPLSLFKSHPEAVSGPPPDGRNSGYLVVKGADDEGGDDETCCWGTFGASRVRDLPFPQNRVLEVRYTKQQGKSSRTYSDAVVFVPVADQPLASNRYYPVIATGRHRGLVRACSAEEDMVPCCFSRCINDVDPRPFDPADIYQQIEIVQRRRGRFTARAVAPDGFPYFLYRKKYWRVYASKPKSFDLQIGEARGLDAALRSRQLSDAGVLDAFPAPTNGAVGKWYSPFFLVKEDGVAPREQMERSAFYEVTLEQRWEPVDAHSGGGSKLASTRAYIGGSVEAKQEAGNSRHSDAYVWFRAAAAAAAAAATGQRVGLCTVDEEEDSGKVAGGSVLVERFVVKRLDGTVVLAFDFVHLNKVRAKQL